jgi:hypothetical protein
MQMCSMSGDNCGGPGHVGAPQAIRYLCAQGLYTCQLLSVQSTTWFQDHNLGQGRPSSILYLAIHSCMYEKRIRTAAEGRRERSANSKFQTWKIQSPHIECILQSVVTAELCCLYSPVATTQLCCNCTALLQLHSSVATAQLCCNCTALLQLYSSVATV